MKCGDGHLMLFPTADMRESIRADMGGNLSHHLYGGYGMPGYPNHG